MHGLNNMLKRYSEKFIPVLLLLSIVSIFCLPNIYFKPSLPYIRPEEFLLPFLFVFLIPYRKEFFQSHYVKLILAFAVYVLITIFINFSTSSLSDYFESIKLIKFAVFFFFFQKFLPVINWKNCLKFILLFLFAFNILHYFNLFHFNEWVMPFYADEIQLKYFGLNSLLQPDTKRLLGTMGNPNNNGLLFATLFFVFLLMFEKQSEFIYTLICTLGILTSQSRSVFVIWVVAVLIYWVIKRNEFRKYLWKIMILAFISALFLFEGTKSSQYITSVASPQKIESSQSFKGRVDAWRSMIDLYKMKPIFGHGPSKQFIYANNFYPEDEYLFFAFRYGIVGLLFYLLLLIYPLYSIYKSKMYMNKLISFFGIILFAAAAITNTPLSEPRLLIMFAFIISLPPVSLNEKTLIDRK